MYMYGKIFVPRKVMTKKKSSHLQIFFITIIHCETTKKSYITLLNL